MLSGQHPANSNVCVAVIILSFIDLVSSYIMLKQVFRIRIRPGPYNVTVCLSQIRIRLFFIYIWNHIGWFGSEKLYQIFPVSFFRIVPRTKSYRLPNFKFRVYKETVEKTRVENDRLCLEAKEGLVECETALVKIAAKEREIVNKSDIVARYAYWTFLLLDKYKVKKSCRNHKHKK